MIVKLHFSWLSDSLHLLWLSSLSLLLSTTKQVSYGLVSMSQSLVPVLSEVFGQLALEL